MTGGKTQIQENTTQAENYYLEPLHGNVVYDEILPDIQHDRDIAKLKQSTEKPTRLEQNIPCRGFQTARKRKFILVLMAITQVITFCLIGNHSVEIRNFESALQRGDMETTVAFKAYYVSDTSPGPNQKIVFVRSFFDTRDCYNNTVGVFIAPVSGLYWFAVQLCTAKNKSLVFTILANVKVAPLWNTLHDKDSIECITYSTLVTLDRGGEVYVRSGGGTDEGNVIYQDMYTRNSFMGVLIK